MAEIGRAALFGKLNSMAYKSIEGATVFCKMRGNPYVELVHWWHQVLQQPDSDFHRIIRHFNLNLSKLAADLVATQVLPSDRTLLVERFRDELGDWRLVVHSPYGARVHAPEPPTRWSPICRHLCVTICWRASRPDWPVNSRPSMPVRRSWSGKACSCGGCCGFSSTWSRPSSRISRREACPTLFPQSG